jgi:hypothetical protein
MGWVVVRQGYSMIDQEGTLTRAKPSLAEEVKLRSLTTFFETAVDSKFVPYRSFSSPAPAHTTYQWLPRPPR